jgi:hypothetical protein
MKQSPFQCTKWLCFTRSQVEPIRFSYELLILHFYRFVCTIILPNNYEPRKCWNIKLLLNSCLSMWIVNQRKCWHSLYIRLVKQLRNSVVRTNNTALTHCSTVLFVSAIRGTNSNHIRHSWINLLKSQWGVNNEQQDNALLSPRQIQCIKFQCNAPK